uniref:BRICHOS domain-containing protein n=1 Tax=Strigamia maritima TaxID=126957 RepID=T1J9X0_STRMM
LILPFSPVIPPENRRLKIIAAIIFVFLVLIAAAALVGIYLSQPPPPPEVYTIRLKDPDALSASSRSVRLKVKYDKMSKVEYTMTPSVDNPAEIIYMLKDFSRALVVHKDFKRGLCLVGRLNDTEDNAKQRAKAFKNKLLQIASTEQFLILSGTVHSEVLEFTAGWRVARYCGSLPAHWVVKFEPPVNQPEVEHVTQREPIEVESVPPTLIEEQPGEEEKMQLLTESLSPKENKEAERLPPEDPALIQRAEDIAVLEEKTSILAEKLDLPEKTIRPSFNGPPIVEKLAMLEEKIPHELIPTIFEENGDGKDGLDDDDDTGLLYSEKLLLADKLIEDRTENIKSSADEKSTVEKGHEDSFGLPNNLPSSTDFPYATETSLHEEKYLSSTNKFVSRRKRSACDVHCWYYIRKTKGYKRFLATEHEPICRS